MAIVLQKQKRSINFFSIGVVVFLLGFLAFATYYLFFAPSPKFEAIIPSPLQRANELDKIEFVDPERIIGNSKFTRLKQFEGDPGTGSLGRSNPFEKF